MSSSASSLSSSEVSVSDRIRILREMRMRKLGRQQDQGLMQDATASSLPIPEHERDHNYSADLEDEDEDAGRDGLTKLLARLREKKMRRREAASQPPGEHSPLSRTGSSSSTLSTPTSSRVEKGAVESNEDLELPDYDLQKAIVRQVEYYFGDYNLPRDKFILNLMEEDSGWISMETMLTFPRLSNLSKSPEFILNALSLLGSGLLQIDRIDQRIRRDSRKPLPERSEERRLSIQEKTVFVHNFPRDGSVGLDELIDFFEKNFENVANLRVRRGDAKVDQDGPGPFLGSCFVTFSSREAAEQFIMEKEKLKFVEKKTEKQECTFRQLGAIWQKDYLNDRPETNDSFDASILRKTVCVHGFDRTDTTDAELDYFFAQIPGIDSFRRRQFRVKNNSLWYFSGGAFVTFEDESKAESFMRNPDPPRLQNGDKIFRTWQLDFFKKRGLFKSQVRAVLSGGEESK